jgi:hypothetical protein
MAASASRHRSSPSRLATTADRVGVLGSLMCALHCALMPLVLALVPALGVGLSGLGDLDQIVVVFATVLGVTSLSLGFRRHRAFRAWVLLVPGLVLVWAGSFTALHDHSMAHVLLMVAGGLLIAGAHLLNLRLSHQALLPVRVEAGAL